MIQSHVCYHYTIPQHISAPLIIARTIPCIKLEKSTATEILSR